jgi:hypothetical protein
MLLKNYLAVAGLALVQGSLASLQIVRLHSITECDGQTHFGANTFRSRVGRGLQLVQTNMSRLMAEVCLRHSIISLVRCLRTHIS